MVAELTSIASAVANNNSHKQVTHAPRWIQAATKPSVHRYQCSSDQPMYTTVSKPKDASESTGRGNGGDVAGTTATDPVGLLSRRGIVGLVGPYRASSDGLDAMGTRDQRASTRGSEGRIFVLRDEELVEEGDYNEPSRVCLAENSRKRLPEDDSVSDASPTPGRENWKLREGKNLTGDARGEAGERGGVSLTDVWHKDWGDAPSFYLRF
ncbi:uncharacterized protein LOC110838838 [Zootermopsis nevadensis]|uniref:Uncharacterized protein n=1 Tax=Zootermopsis nevadensis TaxID=136037 RepID=A0A067QM82_ZOONE|nr:uncharacterized protein LOC110838838 [Zootermopsis nevadensis]KDR09295.1 hypothetical protein L798_01031 [Zootermopsis nevadensis]